MENKKYIIKNEVKTKYKGLKKMGKMELLKAGYTGKVGTIYGSKGHGKINAKVVPFSHTPHNENQKQAFSAFACLLRLSVFISKKLWEFLGLSNRKMLKQNAVAQWLKPLISAKTFDMSKFTDLIKDDHSQVISMARYVKSTQEIRIDFERTVERPQGVKSKTLIIVADNVGRGYVADSTENLLFTKVYNVSIEDFAPMAAVIFERHVIKNKVIFTGCAVKPVEIID